MARKGTKIKRYGNIYGRGMGAGSWPILIAMFFGVLLFGAVGWSLYTPVHDFIMKLGDEPPAKASTAVSASAPAEPQTQISKDSPENVPGSKPEPEDIVSSIPSAQLRGIYLPQAQLSDSTVLSNMLTDAVNTGLNTVVVDAKDATGTVLFSSENELAQSTGAALDTAYSAEQIARAISDKGLVPAARIHVFRDSIAPMQQRDMAVHYYDTDIYWYDNSPELGGKPWLNPYSQAARQYIISLSSELCSQGFKIILLDSVHFPTGVGLDKAGYGTEAKTTSKNAVLEQFISSVSAAVKAKGGELVLCTQEGWAPTKDAVLDEQIEANNLSLYGGSPAKLFTARAVLPMPLDASLWPQALKSAALASDGTDWIGFISAFSADGTLVDCAKLTSSFKEAGGGNYLLFNPQGSYKLQ